jgi:colanic acid biosynthesis glycosyl transferase WcaI
VGARDLAGGRPAQDLRLDLQRVGQGRTQPGLSPSKIIPKGIATSTPTPATEAPRLLLYYHFFHPDDVVSARHFGDLAEEQQRRGWQVTVLTSNRSCRQRGQTFAPHESWNGVEIHRVFRPDWDQSKPLFRLLNSSWMIAAWFLRTLGLGRFDAIIVGSDPAFSPALALGLRLAYPRAALVHWCFDLYPEAIQAEGDSVAVRALTPVARQMMALSYRAFDSLVDLGPRMQARLGAYRSGATQETLVPWALAEAERVAAPDLAVRAELFGDAKLGLLYSGNLGRAHEFEPFLRLARACRARSGDAISFCFAARGYREGELRRAVTPADSNVRFAPFADESALQSRLEAADLHLLSLRPEWAGIVVPSKFFGSLAVGRPVIYAGPADSEVASWIAQHDVGLHLEQDDQAVAVAADRLHALLADASDVTRWQANALAVYQCEFSKRAVNDRFDTLLRRLVAHRAPGGRAT